jgi:hypothetical protein
VEDDGADVSVLGELLGRVSDGEEHGEIKPIGR